MPDPDFLTKTLVTVAGQFEEDLDVAIEFSGGCERWLQMQIALSFARAGWTVNEDIFCERPYAVTGMGKANGDILLKHGNYGSGVVGDEFFGLELKVTGGTAPGHGAINDVFKVWNQPTFSVPAVGGGGGGGGGGATISPADGGMLVVVDTAHYDLKRFRAELASTFSQEAKAAGVTIPAVTVSDQMNAAALGRSGRFVALTLYRNYSHK